MMSFLHRNELNPDQEALPFGGKGYIFAEANDKIEIRVRAGGYSPAPAHRIRKDVSVENLNIFLEASQTSGAVSRRSHPDGTGLRTLIGKQIYIMRSK